MCKIFEKYPDIAIFNFIGFKPVVPKSSHVELVLGIPNGDTVGEGNFTMTKQFAQRFIEQFKYGNKNARVGIFEYNDKPRTIVELNQGTSLHAVTSFVQKMQFSGGGNRVDRAWRHGATMFSKGGRTDINTGFKKSFVLLSSGQSSPGSEDLGTTIRSLSGFNVVPVAVGPSAKAGSAKISKDYLYYDSFPKLVTSGHIKAGDLAVQGGGSDVTTHGGGGGAGGGGGGSGKDILISLLD